MASEVETDVPKDHQLNADLCNALLKKDTKRVKDLCKSSGDDALHILSIHDDTVLHTATFSGQVGLVLDLLKALPPLPLDKITRKNRNGNNILHEAATLDDPKSVEVAEEMLKKAPDLWRIPNKLGETALFRAARYGSSDFFIFLADKIRGSDEATQKPYIQRDDNATVLHAAVLGGHFALALKIANWFSHIVGERDEDGMTALQLLSCKPSAFEAVHKRGPLKRMSSFVNQYNGSAQNEKSNHESLLGLTKLLIGKDTSWDSIGSPIDRCKPTPHRYGSGCFCTSFTEKEGNGDDERASGDDKGDSGQVQHCAKTPLFLATESGCIEIVKQILEKYPQAVGHIDNKGRTILHEAIMYRQLKVYERVLNMEIAKRWLVRRLDNDGNSILHMVGMKRKDYTPQKLRGPALELQEELLWFERVESITVPHLIDHRNNKRLTAEGLFATTYNGLRNEAREWIKRTAEGCSIVSVLIATVAFAAAYTLPGGLDEKSGLPVLYNRPFFVVFSAADVLSLACALTSVVIFLSVLTAPFRLKDFKRSLPNKLMLGFTFLFFSVSMMMIAFAATIILMIRDSKKWTQFMLYTLSFLPVSIFALSYLRLYVALTRTYKYLLEKIEPILRRIFCPILRRICCPGQSNRPQANHKSEGRDLNV